MFHLARSHCATQSFPRGTLLGRQANYRITIANIAYYILKVLQCFQKVYFKICRGFMQLLYYNIFLKLWIIFFYFSVVFIVLEVCRVKKQTKRCSLTLSTKPWSFSRRKAREHDGGVGVELMQAELPRLMA